MSYCVVAVAEWLLEKQNECYDKNESTKCVGWRLSIYFKGATYGNINDKG